MPNGPHQNQKIEGSSIENSQLQLGQTNSGDLNHIQGSNNWIFKFVLNLSKRPELTHLQASRYRHALLDRVRKFWIEGDSEQSLFNKIRIEVGLEQCFAKLALEYEIFEKSRQSSSIGTRVSEKFFDQVGRGRALLILGESGAGKTTILLELAKDLLAKAEQNASQPMPVVFNLSSWSRQPLADWLVQQLNESPYCFSPLHIKAWLRDEQLSLLLDGLNEINSKESRELCVGAINEFRRQYSAVDIIICSQTRSYESLSTQLDFLHDKISINPLKIEQIEDYLSQASDLEAIRAALHSDSVLQGMLSTPLMLNVTILAYRGESVDELLYLGSEKLRDRLWDIYIQNIWERTKGTSYYSRKRAMNWLIWLAKRMKRSSKIFLIERLQPDHLQNSKQKHIYGFLLLYTCTWLILFPLAHIVGMFMFPGSLKVGDLGDMLLNFVMFILFSSYFTALIYKEDKNIWRQKIEAVEVLSWSLKDVFEFMIDGLTYPFKVDDRYREFRGRQDSREQYILAHPILMTLLYVVALPIFLPYIWTIRLICSPIAGVSISELDRKIEPNQGVWRSLKNSMIGGFVGGLTGMLAGQCLILSFLWIVYLSDLLNSANEIVEFTNIYIFIKTGLVCGLIGLYLGWLFCGGTTAIQHFILRLILSKTGKTPYNYSHFLDWATERLFLQKVGGGYKFIHPSLVEHFAQMGENPQRR